MKKLFFTACMLLSGALFSLSDSPILLTTTEGSRAAHFQGLVHAITGHLFLTHEDAIIGTDYPLCVKRTYHPQADNQWSLFDHCRLHYEKKPFEVLSYHTESGSLITFMPDSSGGFTVRPACFEAGLSGRSLSKMHISKEKNSLILQTGTSNVKRFYMSQKNSNLYLLQEENHAGIYTTCYTYDHLDRLQTVSTHSSVSDHTFAKITLNYEQNHITLKGSDGTQIIYTYQDGRLNSVHKNNTELYSYAYDKYLTIYTQSGKRTQIAYYDTGSDTIGSEKVEIKSKLDPRYGRVKSLTDEQGKTARFLYKMGKGKIGGQTIIYETDGSYTAYRYSNSLHLTGIEYYDIDGARAYSEQFVWDNNDLVCHTKCDRYYLPILSLTYTYNKDGNKASCTKHGNLTGQCRTKLTLSSEHTPLKNGCESYTTHHEYEKGLLKMSREDNGRWTQYLYHKDVPLILCQVTGDSAGEKGRTHFKYDQDFVKIHPRELRQAKTPSPLAKDLDITLNRFGQILSVKKDNALIESYRYGDITRPVACTNSQGDTTSLVYQADGKPTLILYPDHTKEQMIYYLDGNLRTLVTRTGVKHLFEYDLLGNVTSKKTFMPDGRVVKQETWKYDGEHCLSYQDGNGELSQYTYTQNGSIATTKTGAKHLKYTYDANEIASVDHIDWEENIIGKTRTIKDPSGRQIAVEETPCADTAPAPSDAYGRPQLAAGHSLTYTSPSSAFLITKHGEKISFTFDLFGRCQTIFSDDNTIDYTFAYDAMDHLLSVTDNKGTSSFEYTNDKLTSHTSNYDVTTSYTYDHHARKTDLVLPDQSKISYTYNPYHLSSVVRTHRSGIERYCHIYEEYDALGRPTLEHLPVYLGDSVCDYSPSITSTPFGHYQETPFSLKAHKRSNPVNTQSDWTFITDLLGRITKASRDEIEYSFFYDALNHLTAYQTPEGFYRTIFDQDQPIGTLDERGKIVELQVPGLKGLPIAHEVGHQILVPTHHESTLRALISLSTRDLCATFSYDENGEVSIESDEIKLPSYRFDGCRMICPPFAIKGGRVYDTSKHAYVHNAPLSGLHTLRLPQITAPVYLKQYHEKSLFYSLPEVLRTCK